MRLKIFSIGVLAHAFCALVPVDFLSGSGQKGPRLVFLGGLLPAEALEPGGGVITDGFVSGEADFTPKNKSVFQWPERAGVLESFGRGFSRERFFFAAAITPEKFVGPRAGPDPVADLDSRPVLPALPERPRMELERP